MSGYEPGSIDELRPVTLAELVEARDFTSAADAGVRSVSLLASEGRYTRRRPQIFGLTEGAPVPPMFGQSLEDRIQHFPALYRAELNDATVTGQGTVISKNSFLITDSCWEMQAQGLVPDGLASSATGSLRLMSPPTRRVDAPSLLLKRPWWRNYGHWLVDSAALLALLDGVAMPVGWQVVMGAFSDPQMRQIAHETLRLLAPGVPIVEHWDHETWVFRELHYTSPVSRPPFFKLPTAMAALRARLLSSYFRRSIGGKFYITRGADRSRQLVNEPDVIDVCKAHGFTVISPEHYPLRQQAQLFNSAAMVIGVKGAALTNLLFCNSSATTIVLSPSSWQEPFFWDIAGQLGVRYLEVLGEPVGSAGSPATQAFSVNIEVLEQALKAAEASDWPSDFINDQPLLPGPGVIARRADQPEPTGEQPDAERPEFYRLTLTRIHQVLQPRAYLEIGVLQGDTFRLASCPSIGVDPNVSIEDLGESAVPRHMFRMTSDAFFMQYDPTQILNRRIDLAFLDGMHLSEFLLRDFINTEKYCHQGSCIVLDDCIPADRHMAGRDPNDAGRRSLSSHPEWWTGDVWKVVVMLKKYRPDLRVTAVNTDPVGLIFVTNLDPASSILTEEYDGIVDEMMQMPDEACRLDAYRASLSICGTNEFGMDPPGILGIAPFSTPERQSADIAADGADVAVVRQTPPADVSNSGRISVHIRNIGDVDFALGDWAGKPGVAHWLEGFRIVAPHGVAAGDIEYRPIYQPDSSTEWCSSDQYCGTRGRSLPINGFAMRLLGLAAKSFECRYWGLFADGTEAAVCDTEEPCVTASKAPLVGMRVLLLPRQ